MGAYLNSKNPFGLFRDEAEGNYFIDKSGLLCELIPLVNQRQNGMEALKSERKPAGQEALLTGKSNKYICITRPRRFGKTLAASMVASFFSKGVKSREIFKQLNVGASEEFEAHINKHNVFYISFNEIPQNCSSYQQYISRIEKRLRKDLILSAMVVYGFLSFYDGHVSISNKELMDKFVDMIRKEPDLGYVYRLAKESGRMLQATKAGDVAEMAEILERTHHYESPIMSYNNEAELAAVVNLVYLEARDTYRVEREDKAGIGFVDFIFYPLDLHDDCIILELKVNQTPRKAIEQIKERGYALNFQKKPGEKKQYTGRILAVGIAYDKKSKKHCCEVEVLREGREKGSKGE